MSLVILLTTPCASSSLTNLLARTHLSTQCSTQRLGRENSQPVKSKLLTRPYKTLQDLSPAPTSPTSRCSFFVSLLTPPVSQPCSSLGGFAFPGPPTWQMPPPELSQTSLAPHPCSSSVLTDTFLTALLQVPKPALPVILLPAALSEVISILFLLLRTTLLEGRDLQYWSALYPQHLKLPGPGMNE